MRYWIAVTTPENAVVVRRTRTWGVIDKYKPILLQLCIGDKMAVYVKGGNFDGIYEINSEVYNDETPIFMPKQDRGFVEQEGFNNRVKLKPISNRKAQIPIKAIMHKLSFIRNRLLGKHFSPFFPLSIALAFQLSKPASHKAL